jgi:hypothetical protein
LLLIDILPQLARELELLLKKQGELDLAAQVSTLNIIDRCRCGDDFCSSLYTQPKPEGRYGPDYRCFDLDAAEGMIIIDVASSLIAHVEILNRNDVRRSVVAAFP